MYVTKKHFESWVEWLFLSQQIEAAWRLDPTHNGKGGVWEAAFVWKEERYRCTVNVPLAYPMAPDWRALEARRQAKAFLCLAGAYERGPLDGCTDLAVGLSRIREDTLHSVLTRLPSSVYVDTRVITEAP